MRLFIRPRHGRSENLGIYTADYARKETPYSLTAGIAVGVFLLVLGAIFAFAIYKEFLEERNRFGSADFHWGGWLFEVGIICYGAVLVWPGVTFWYRRISEVRRARHERERRRRESHS